MEKALIKRLFFFAIALPVAVRKMRMKAFSKLIWMMPLKSKLLKFLMMEMHKTCLKARKSLD
jgi:hypothetical protein